MSDPAQLDPEGSVELDFTPRTIPDQDRLIVRRILGASMPEYELADDYVPPDQWRLVVRVRDISPPWDVLSDYYKSLAADETSEDECTLPLDPEVDEGSELRLYPIRPRGQPIDIPPITVVISWRDGVVIGLG